MTTSTPPPEKINSGDWLKFVLIIGTIIGLIAAIIMGGMWYDNHHPRAAWKTFWDNKPVLYCDNVPEGFIPVSRKLEISLGPWGDTNHFRLKNTDGKFIMVCPALYTQYHDLPEMIHYTGQKNNEGEQ